MSSIRQTLVDLAVSYDGCTVSADLERYLELVAPGDPRRSYFAHPETSGCALTVCGLWRLAGVVHPILERPYVVGHGIANVVEIARAAKAWNGAAEILREHLFPRPGDVVLVGPPEHVYTVVIATGNDWCESIDGGQRDARGQQAIERRARYWVRHRGGVSDNAVGGSSRAVLGFVDVSKLEVREAPISGPKGCALGS